MRAYISGKITGVKDYMEKFAKAEADLNTRGYDVVNPAKILGNLPDGTRWNEYMKVALVLEELCDKVYFLKGWETSAGARQEMKKAIDDVMEIEMEA